MSTKSYSKSATSAVSYLAARVLNDEWVSEHDDVAYYFKAPLAFLEAGYTDDARRALAVAERYAEHGGVGSASPVYSGPYPHCPWLWMFWAATRLGSEDLAQRCFENFSRYIHPASGSGLASAPFSDGEAFEADFFATAMVVKFNLLHGFVLSAERAADALLLTIEENRVPMAAGQFYLRWTTRRMDFADADEQPILVRCEDTMHCVRQGDVDQQYSMLGFPALVLLELAGYRSPEEAAEDARPRRAAEYVQGAERLLAYLKACEGSWESMDVPKVARAAAIAGDRETAERLGDFMVSQQSDLGCYVNDSESMDCVDRTAEIAVCLRQLEHDLRTSNSNIAWERGWWGRLRRLSCKAGA
eukprot:TRINITY_DN16278_c0_g1_i1.p1 TRINITY_DN16278_c0_g1~~TRINITY_DN16278_c0_g1_i1.p1  ORF type:complete len:359 (-),score=58.31 TRINITY_DN16278_c0_g1_i1:119-1195(-)